MGAPNAFEYRRQELKEMSRNGEETITDEQVTQSFLGKFIWSFSIISFLILILDSVGPNGLMTKYIAYGTLAVLLGDCFFFHGGLHENTIGWVSLIHISHYLLLFIIYYDYSLLWNIDLFLHH